MAKKDPITDLYEIMRDHGSPERDRLNAAVSASRVEKLAMPGEAPPEAIVWLRRMVDDLSAPTGYRRESAAALAYYERRCKKAELTYNVPDVDERRRAWRGIVNGSLRVHLGRHGHWPARKDVLFTAADTFEMPAIDPDLALSALLGGGSRQPKRRQKAIDERVPGTWSGTEAERKAVLRPLVQLVHARLKAFGLAG